MKFSYRYRTADNAVHDGEISAATRDEAFAALKARGIKPVKVEEAPGFANKLFGKGKRWMAIGVLGVACLALLALALRTEYDARRATREPRTANRHQIYGDPALLAEMEANGFESVFASLGERILATFAQPGRESVGLATFIRGPVPDKIASAALAASLTNEIVFAAADAREVVELKEIVNGLKAEMAECLAGGDTPASYLEQLRLRQAEEAAIYNRVRAELENEADDRVRDEKNAALRALGLRTVLKKKK